MVTPTQIALPAGPLVWCPLNPFNYAVQSFVLFFEVELNEIREYRTNSNGTLRLPQLEKADYNSKDLLESALAAATNRTIMIRNTAPNSLVLSGVTVNIPGAEVRVREAQPGRLFNLTVDFPAGFQIKPDQKHELTLKSNHPKYSLIKVPVFQPQPADGATATQPPSAPIRVGPTGPEAPGGTGK